jgi:hypothetical protein
MLVPGGASYDITLEQSAELTRIRSGVTPGPGANSVPIPDDSEALKAMLRRHFEV